MVLMEDSTAFRLQDQVVYGSQTVSDLAMLPEPQDIMAVEVAMVMFRVRDICTAKVE